MAFVPNPFGVPGVVTGLLAFAVAAIVYFTRPSRRQNRLLALLLVLEGSVTFLGTGLMFLTDAYATAYAWQAVTIVVMLALPPVYLLFLGTLETPLARPLASRPARVLLAAAAVLLPLLWFGNRGSIVATLVPVPFAPWEIVPGPGWTVLVVAFAATYGVGTIFTWHQWVRTRAGSPARRQATAYLAAFMVHDVAFFLIGFGPHVAPSLVGGYFYAFGPPVMQLLFLPLLAYGILRAQLFDIDLRIKRGVRGSTLAAIFVGVFFVVSETAQQVFSEEWGPYLGIAAAGLLLFAIAPLQRVVERFADAAMPHVHPGPEYVSFKKLEVYKTAVEGVFQDGALTERETRMLARLRERLGIRAEDAAAIEADVAGAGRA